MRDDNQQDGLFETRTLTQQRAAKLDRNAVRYAERNDISDRELINEMARGHSRPDSAEAISESVGALLHTRVNMKKKAPVHDALQRIRARQHAEESAPLYWPDPA